ncbi:replication initiator [Luteipulveratus mongoliensis]|uniref:Replication initiation protein n=1 Tax=Luteipulveratus mongoliensis TaxID=571913 RepID=A0A0K1JN23_9MICO|nr:replication initiator [Luteipulveratus mongoliensis]AKU18106.1 hypothetical protein VV02_23290 [Luteipulveratus mongoliensis]
MSTFHGHGEDAPLHVPGLDSPQVQAGLASRLADGSFAAFEQTAASVGYCSNPIRLVGSSTTVDTKTGEVVGSFSSEDAPLGALYRRCGNRRDHVCPSCSRLYARDTFELIRAGVQGGKQVPTDVADNPLVFLTLTAPSFGHVHGARVHGGPCRPRRRDDRTRCVHGRPMWCHARHETTDDEVGAPLCSECYRYDAHVIWQWWSPELWRRLTIEVRRALASRLGVAESRLADVASVQYAKVAEYQARGVIHFHALIRLDGPASAGVGSPAPASLDGNDLAQLLRDAVARVAYTAPAARNNDDTTYRLTFGRQVDARTVRAGSRTDAPDGPLTPGQVAGYLAKYATKDATAAAGTDRRSTPHLRRIKDVCRDLHAHARDRETYCRATNPDHVDPYRLLGKWAHALGFRGHFSTKSRRYSITLGALRRARVRWQAIAAESRRTGDPIDTADLEARLLAADDEETTLVVGEWAYAGTGWETPGDAALANAAAARAREYDQWKADHKSA